MKILKYKRQEIKITKSVILEAERFSDNDNCLMATAMRRHGFEGVNCGVGSVMTSLGGFTYSRRAEDRIQRSYPRDADGFIEEGKPLRNAKPFSVIITPCK